MACESSNCIEPISSSCVFYQGSKLTSLDETKLVCNVTITDVLQEINNVLFKIKSSTDLSQLNNKCFTFDKLTVKQSELNQLFIDKLCEQSTKLDLIQNVNNNDVISNAIINVSCNLADCNNTSKTLKDFLQSLCTQINTLTDEIAKLKAASTVNSNTNLYLPNGI